MKGAIFMGLKENFAEIQGVINRISEDETLSEKFFSFGSLRLRFDFTKKKCKEFSISGDYSIEEFEKFLFFTDVVQEINSDERFSDEFRKTTGIGGLYNILVKKIDDMELSVRVDRSDFEAFIESFSGGAEKIPPEHLDAVSGGGAVESWAETKAQVRTGEEMGSNLKTIFDLIFKKKKKK